MNQSLGLLLMLLAAGCTSMRSTMLNRMPDDSYVKNTKVASKGVPVTVKVPTHLDVVVVETLLYYDANHGTSDELSKYQLTPVDFGRDRNLKITSSIVTTPKVMTVDFVRPLAGVAEYNLSFDTEEQYITQMETFLFDRTLQDVGNLFAAVTPGAGQSDRKDDPSATDFLLKSKASSSAGGDVADNADGFQFGSQVDNYFVKNRVVAYQRFDLNACDFEQVVAAFVHHHLNACYDCQGRHLPQAEVSNAHVQELSVN